MLKLIVRRLVSMPFVIFSITFITFIVGYLAPGDPILTMMGARHDQQTYDRLRHMYGLDLPWYQQYGNYMSGLVQGNLGLSFRYQGRPVSDLIGAGVSTSFTLGLTALSLSLMIGIPVGVLAALRQNSVADRGS